MINENQKPTNDNYRRGYDRIFGKKRFGSGKQTKNAKGRKHDNENMESLALTCHPDQVAWHNKHYGHLGGKWRKDGVCIVKDIKAQRDLFREHRLVLRNDTQGGPGSATRHLIKTGQMTEEMVEPKVKAPPPRKTGMSPADATQILERAKRGMKLTG